MKSLLVGAWLASVLIATYAFHWRYATPVPAPAGAKDFRIGTPAPSIPGVNLDRGVTFLNFTREGCPCSRFVEPEFRALASKYANRAQFINVVEGDPQARDVPVRSIPNADVGRRFGVWAAPAAVVVKDGRVLYVGSYNTARYCSDPKTAFAAQALAAAVENRPVPRARTPFYGCSLSR